MEAIQIILSALWITTMLTYLLGDVLRIFSGDFKAGEMGSSGGMKMTQPMMLGIAVLMVVPIVMVFLTLVLGYPGTAGQTSSWQYSFSCSTLLDCPPIHQLMTNF